MLVIANVLFYIFGSVVVYELFDLFIMKLFGLFLITAALICMYTAQLQMGKHWRIGIDNKNKVDIIETGFFRYLRHPIYFFVVITGFGMIMIIPTLESLLIFFLLWTIVSIQSRLEEEFMLSKFGERYRKFMNTRKRWFS